MKSDRKKRPGIPDADLDVFFKTDGSVEVHNRECPDNPVNLGLVKPSASGSGMKPHSPFVTDKEVEQNWAAWLKSVEGKPLDS